MVAVLYYCLGLLNSSYLGFLFAPFLSVPSGLSGPFCPLPSWIQCRERKRNHLNLRLECINPVFIGILHWWLSDAYQISNFLLSFAKKCPKEEEWVLWLTISLPTIFNPGAKWYHSVRLPLPHLYTSTRISRVPYVLILFFLSISLLSLLLCNIWIAGISQN